MESDKRGQRDGFGRAERRIPSGAMLDWCNRSPVFRLIVRHDAITYQLLPGLRLLALGEPRELLGSYRNRAGGISRPACRAIRPE
jgi:hypothetical protein